MLTGKELAKIANPAGGKTAEVMKKAKDYVGSGISFYNYIIADEAKGAIIKDIEGNMYLDFYAGIGVLNLGHRPDEVVDAIKKQADKAIHTMINFCVNEPYIDLAKKLAEVAPFDEPMQAAFANSGSEAVENVIKVAKAYTKRSAVMTFTNAFHGRTMLTSTITFKARPFRAGLGPGAPETYRMPSAYFYRYGKGMTEEEYIKDLLKEIEFNLVHNFDAENMAVMIIEPIQGEGGILVQPPAFLHGLKSICEKYGIVFAADEVQAGFCRSGKWFAIEHAGFAPDLMSVAKSIASGMPISAVVGKKALMSATGSGQLGGTYGGNPLSCVAAIATIDAYKSKNLCERAIIIGNYMKQRFEGMQKNHPQIGDIRGLGAMMAVELVKDPVTKEPYAEAVGKVITECQANGLIIIPAGARGNCIRFLPPLIVTNEQLAQGMDILEAVFDSILDK